MEKKLLITTMVLIAALVSLGVFAVYSLENSPANFNVLNSPTNVGNSTQYPISIGVVTSYPSVVTDNNTLANYIQYYATVTNSSALNLTMNVQNATIQSGQYIDIVINEENTLNATNIVNASSNWASYITTFYEYDLAIAPGLGTLPIGLALFQGYYTASNISSATSLSIIKPGLWFTFAGIYPVTSYAFQPLSDIAAFSTVIPLNETLGGTSLSPAQMSNELITNGYWTDSNAGDTLGQDAVFHNFESGVYTVAGGDEWGQLVILHFYVT